MTHTGPGFNLQYYSYLKNKTSWKIENNNNKVTYLSLLRTGTSLSTKGRTTITLPSHNRFVDSAGGGAGFLKERKEFGIEGHTCFSYVLIAFFFRDRIYAAQACFRLKWPSHVSLLRSWDDMCHCTNLLFICKPSMKQGCHESHKKASLKTNKKQLGGRGR